jgi:segregation and condensation protein A
MTYEIKLPIFEGPFDLLLFFIERDEVDIYDIPIAKITNDFLHYLTALEKMNIELAGEFVFVAASLMRIKAKMLLPRPETDESGKAIDPRMELVKQLLDYKRYKAWYDEFARMEENMLARAPRGNTDSELRAIGRKYGIEANLQDVDLYKLMLAYKEAIENYEEIKDKEKLRSIIAYPYTVEGQRDFVRMRLREERKMPFAALAALAPNRPYFVFTFLAVLELLQQGEIFIRGGNEYNSFDLYYDEEAA